VGATDKKAKAAPIVAKPVAEKVLSNFELLAWCQEKRFSEPLIEMLALRRLDEVCHKMRETAASFREWEHCHVLHKVDDLLKVISNLTEDALHFGNVRSLHTCSELEPLRRAGDLPHAKGIRKPRRLRSKF